MVRQLTLHAEAVSANQETEAIVGAYLLDGEAIEGHTIYGTSGQRYEALEALKRPLNEHGREIGSRYLLDANTAEAVIRAGDLSTVARRQLGSGLVRGWLDARMAGIGWVRCRVQGFGPPRRPGDQGPHLRADVYRGLLSADDDE